MGNITVLKTPTDLDRLAKQGIEVYREYYGSKKDTLVFGVELGGILREAKKLCKKGEFIPWVTSNFPFERNWANVCMRAHEAMEAITLHGLGTPVPIWERVDSIRDLAALRDLAVEGKNPWVANVAPKKPRAAKVKRAVNAEEFGGPRCRGGQQHRRDEREAAHSCPAERGHYPAYRSRNAPGARCRTGNRSRLTPSIKGIIMSTTQTTTGTVPRRTSMTIEEVTANMKSAIAECDAAQRDSLHYSLVVGNMATRAKDLMPHKAFTPWLEANFSVSVQWIRTCMRAALAWGLMDAAQRDEHKGDSVQSIAALQRPLAGKDPITPGRSLGLPDPEYPPGLRPVADRSPSSTA